MAGLAAAAWLLHALDLARVGELADLWWGCNVATLALAAGLYLDERTIVATCTFLLAGGLPLWLIGLATGARFLPTSLLTHGLAPALGVYALARLGVPAGTWWKALAAMAALIAVARLATPPARNVNLAFAIWPGFERYFASHARYLTCVLIGHALAYRVAERLAMRWATAGAS